MVELAAHLPGGDLPWIGFRLEVIGSTVQPVSIPVYVKVIIVSELIEWVMLEVMRLNLLILSGLWLVLESRLIRDP